MIHWSERSGATRSSLVPRLRLVTIVLVAAALVRCSDEQSAESSQRNDAAVLANLAATSGTNVAGFAIGMYYDHGGADYEALLWEAARSGAQAVNIVVMREQYDVTDSEIQISSLYTPPDEDVRRAIAYARSIDLAVTLMPVVFVKQRGTGLWRGTLRPEDPARWWASYEDFILHYADLTSDLDIDWFVVGSELGSMEGRIVPWANLISEVRGRNNAKLTYSANWDRFDQVPFWSRLDAIGISLYEPVTGDVPDAWKASMMRAREMIEDYAEQLDAPILITEFGFPSRPSARRRPWDSLGDASVDLASQDYLTQLLLQTWCSSSRTRAVFIWNLAGNGGGLDSDYSPRHKPVLNVLETWNRCRKGEP